MRELEGRRVAVTGGSRGIGREICLEMARAGADVALAYNRSADSALAVANEIGSLGQRGFALRADFSDPAATGEFIRGAAGKLGGLDVLVHCAGIFQQNLIGDISDEEWFRVMRINLDSAFFACRAAVPYLRESAGGGRIILFSSQAALAGTAHGAHYAASKAGLLGLTYALSKELGPDGITVNAILPGRIETEMLAYATPERREAWLAATPLGYLGEPRDAAGAAVFLAGERARYITGAKININGGLLPG